MNCPTRRDWWPTMETIRTRIRSNYPRSATMMVNLLFSFGLGMIGPDPALAQTPVVRPLSEILISGPEFIDLRAESVTVLVETRIAVACSAVYGPTSAYGQIATDTDMAAGGHRSHRPTLIGLKPDTVYQMRMQGVGPDGTLFVSENYTFRTAKVVGDQVAARPAGRNVALGATVSAVSSNYGSGALDSSFGGNSAIDGDPATQWSSDGDGDDAWIEIDLGNTHKIGAVGFMTRTMGTSAQIESFQVVTDGGQKFGPFDLPDASSVYYFETQMTARRLLFDVLKSNGGNTGAAEIEIYAD